MPEPGRRTYQAKILSTTTWLESDNKHYIELLSSLNDTVAHEQEQTCVLNVFGTDQLIGHDKYLG